MKNNNSKHSYWSKFFLVFSIIAVFSGVYLIFQRDYIIGIFGTITGLFLVFLQKK